MADYYTAEPFFDWDTGDFLIINGVPYMATGKERLKSRIQKILKTELGKYKIYKGTGFGISLKSIIGKTLASDYKQSEIRRLITEALLAEDDVISIENFSMAQDGTHLNISFMVVSEYGDIDIEEAA